MSSRELIQILDGNSIEIMVSSHASNNTCCVFIESTPVGGGPPPHKHLREEEIFTVMEGDYEFHRDGNWIPMEIGVPVLSLRGTVHAFRNVGRTVGRIMLTTNGGGIDDFFRAISDLKLPDDLSRLHEIGRHYGYIFE